MLYGKSGEYFYLVIYPHLGDRFQSGIGFKISLVHYDYSRTVGESKMYFHPSIRETNKER